MTNIKKIVEAKAILKQAQREVEKAIKMLPSNELDIRRRTQLIWISLNELNEQLNKEKKQ